MKKKRILYIYIIYMWHGHRAMGILILAILRLVFNVGVILQHCHRIQLLTLAPILEWSLGNPDGFSEILPIFKSYHYWSTI